MDDISLFLGFFSVIFAVFSCEMGVKIFYMPLFKPKKGGLELGHGTSKSNRIISDVGVELIPTLIDFHSFLKVHYLRWFHRIDD